ncbi:MAG: tRNA lysidine(34) synthetase TilS [bacterium]
MALFEARLKQFLTECPGANRYWVALSGGLDSTVLLHLLAGLQAEMEFELFALHAHHGLQADADHWQQHCEAQCQALSVPLTICQLSIDPQSGESLEAIARDARYEAFASNLKADDVLLTAHHADDQAETVLLQLLRGAGLHGLAAMPEYIRWQQGWLARPLLTESRAELEAYASGHNLCWVEDQSNRDTRFDRNYLRHEIMPLLKQRWPACTTTIPRSARHCASAAEALDEQAGLLIASGTGEQNWKLPMAVIMEVEGKRQQQLLRHWIKSHDLKLPSEKLLLRIMEEVIAASPEASPLVSWDGAELRRFRQHLYLLPSLPEVPAPMWSADWHPGEALVLPKGLGHLTGELGKTLRVTFRRSGMKCRLSGRQGSRSLKQVFQEFETPPWLRERVPLVFDDDRLIAIGDLVRCEGADQVLSQLQWQREACLQP